LRCLGSWKAIVHLLHRSGARISELLGLSLSDINQEERKFQVIGKGNKQRWCFYNQDPEEALRKYIKYYRHSNSPALFTAQKQFSNLVTRVSYEAVHADWLKITSSCEELKEVRLHDLRHTFATERVGLMGIEELRALMGHNSLDLRIGYEKYGFEIASLGLQ
jgi:integrase/recombinase XerD